MTYRWFGVLLVSAACAGVAGCSGDAGDPRTGAGGTGGAAGGGGGTAGTGGSINLNYCEVSPLCGRCPIDGLCQTNNDCAVGYDCIATGCDTKEGAPIMQCLWAGGGACLTNADCRTDRYTCLDALCVKTTPGCDTDLDCIFGFYCEGAESAKSCVDRRVPCVFDEDCPMNHSCVAAGNGQICARMHRTCEEDFDCAGISQRCADVDADAEGVKECAGVLDPNERPPVACVNASCTDPSAPVCQVSGIGSLAVCGQYGLCLDNRDCNTSAGFECVGLWPDGRKECVPTGGSCNDITDCPPQQVCAAPRTTDDPPSCQAGKE